MSTRHASRLWMFLFPNLDLALGLTRTGACTPASYSPISPSSTCRLSLPWNCLLYHGLTTRPHTDLSYICISASTSIASSIAIAYPAPPPLVQSHMCLLVDPALSVAGPLELCMHRTYRIVSYCLSLSRARRSATVHMCIRFCGAACIDLRYLLIAWWRDESPQRNR